MHIVAKTNPNITSEADRAIALENRVRELKRRLREIDGVWLERLREKDRQIEELTQALGRRPWTHRGAA